MIEYSRGDIVKLQYEAKNTYGEALKFADTCKRPMSILYGDNDQFWVADLFNASRLIKQGYKIARAQEKQVNLRKDLKFQK